MEEIQELYGREMYRFGSPNRSYNKEKRCVGTAKGVLFSGAPNGATKAIKTLILVLFAAKRRKNYRICFFCVKRVGSNFVLIRIKPKKKH